MTGLDRSNWPKAKSFDVVVNGPFNIDIIAKQASTPKELEDIAAALILDMCVFELSRRKMS
jgi:hypothetical protein